MYKKSETEKIEKPSSLNDVPRENSGLFKETIRASSPPSMQFIPPPPTNSPPILPRPDLAATTNTFPTINTASFDSNSRDRQPTVTFATHHDERIVTPTDQYTNSLNNISDDSVYVMQSGNGYVTNDPKVSIFPSNSNSFLNGNTQSSSYPRQVYVDDINQQEAIIRMTDAHYLWQNQVVKWSRYLIIASLWTAFIVLITSVKPFLDPFSNLVSVEGATVDPLYGQAVAQKSIIVTSVFGSIMLLVKLFEVWKPSFSFNPVIAGIDFIATILLIWIAVILGGLTKVYGYKGTMEKNSYHAAVILILFSLELCILSLFCNVSKGMQKKSIDKKRKMVLEGKVNYLNTASLSTQGKLIETDHVRPVRTSGVYLRFMLFFLSWSVFCIAFAAKITMVQVIRAPYLPIIGYYSTSNLIFCAGVIGSLILLVTIFSFVGMTWIGGLLDLFFISSWLAYLIDFGSEPLNGVYGYVDTPSGPIASILPSAATFFVDYFSRHYVLIMVLVPIILLCHFFSFVCCLKLKVYKYHPF